MPTKSQIAFNQNLSESMINLCFKDCVSSFGKSHKLTYNE